MPLFGDLANPHTRSKMMSLIERKEHCATRTFPTITPHFYRPDLTAGDLSNDQLLAGRLLMLSNKEIKPWQRLFNPKDDLELFGRLMYTHRMAFEAESQGQFERADYFWTEAYTGLKSLLADASKWQRIIKSLSADCNPIEMGDSEKARFIFTSEVLLDIHIAFYNGQAHSESLFRRAFAHLDYLDSLLSLSDLTKGESYELLSPGLNDRLRLCRDAGDWKEAVKACRSLIDYAPDPDPYTDALTDLYAEYALSNQSAGEADDSKLLWSITCLENMAKDFPHCLPAYLRLGQLYKLHAERLAARNQFANALLAAHKSLRFAPDLDEAQALCATLYQKIKDIQASADEACFIVASQVDSSLYLEASRIRSEALRAFAPSEEYLASGDALQAQNGYKLARAFRLWRSIGLASPTDNSGAVEIRLLGAAEELSRSAATDKANLETEWRTLAGKDQLLAGLDAAAICSYVSQHGTDVLPLQLPDASASGQNAPCLTVKQSRKQLPAEPLTYWFFSRKDLRIKAQAIAAIILLVIGGVLSLREWWARGTRDQAFLRILQSADQQQNLGVIEAAEEFLANPPLFGKDIRAQGVLDYYDQAIVRWLIENQGQDKTDTENHLNRYKQLTASVNREKSNEKDN